MSCHHRHSGLEEREPEQKSARPDSRTGATAMKTDDDQRREASEDISSATLASDTPAEAAEASKA